MTEALKCPDCSAPLQIPEGGAASIVCPYCNTTVLVPGRSQAGAAGAQHAGAPLNQLDEVVRRLRAGDKIGAVKIYREIYQVGLAEAVKAIDQHERNGGLGPIAAPATSFRPIKASSGVSIANTIGCIGAAIGILVAIIVPILTMTLRRSTVTVKPVITDQAFRKNFIPNLPNVPTVAKTTPAFAQMTLEFGTEGIGAGGFKDSRSVAVDNQGHVYVGEYSDGRVQVFDMSGKFLTSWIAEQGKATITLAADRKGIVYTIVPWKIYRYDGMTGKKLGVLEYAREDQFGGSYNDVFVGLNGQLYAIGNDHDLVTISSDGVVGNIINLKEKVGENVSFQRVVVMGTGEIFALDRDKGVFKFAANGRYINRFGGGGLKSHDFMRGSKPGQLYSPRDIAVDGKGRIHVVDNNSIQVFDEEGTYQGSYGNDVIFGLAITDQNEIYACFRNKYKVRKFVVDEK